MNHSRYLQHIAAALSAVLGVLIAAFLGASPILLMIFVITALLILAILWGYDSLPPAISILSPEPAPQQFLIDTPAFRMIAEGMADPVLLIEQGRVALANHGARTLLGTHIMGEDVRIAIRHPAAAERLTGQEAINRPVKIDIVGLGTRKQRWAMHIIPFDEGDGQQRLFVHLTDESGIQTAERVRGDFVANASHELRTPLAAILGFVETLQDPDTGGEAETRQRFLSILEKEAKRMQQLVDDLMSLSRIEADKYRLPETPINMPLMVEEVLVLCRQNLGARGTDIIAEVNDDVSAIHGDRTQISQLLHNLVSNSAKYGRPGTPITVRLTPAPPSMVRLEVIDVGDGIASDHLPRLTERFYRVDSGRSRAAGGTGLGLAIVKHIVERHRGRLDISSTPGKGTTVSVLLPIPASVMAQKTEKTGHPAPLS